MLSIQIPPASGASSTSTSTSKPATTPTPTSKSLCTPNLLPCRIHHNGPVNASRRHWDPQIGQDGEPTAYFRGRKLKGKEVRVPDGYRGVVVGRKRGEGEEREIGDRRGRVGCGNDAEGRVPDDEEEEDEEEKVEILEELATFEEVIVWDHEKVVEDDDPVVKGMEEWIRFAGAVTLSDADISFGGETIQMHASGDTQVTKELVRR